LHLLLSLLRPAVLAARVGRVGRGVLGRGAGRLARAIILARRVRDVGHREAAGGQV